MSLSSSSIKPRGNRININNFQGVTDEEIYDEFSKFGKIKEMKIYKEHDGTSKYRGYIQFESQKSCQLAKLNPPVFNGIPITIFHQTNGSICEISDDSDFSNLYIIGSLNDEEFAQNSIIFDTQMIRKKLEAIQADIKLKDIEILNQPFLGTFNKQFTAILQYEDNESAQNALNKVTQARESIDINFKCSPAFSWA